MSKLYQLNRMRNSPAAGDIFSTGLKLIGGLFKSKATRTALAAAKKLAANPVAQAVGAGAIAGIGIDLLSGQKAPAVRGAGGCWTGRRRKGITATELRGFRKVAKLLHKEGMTIKKHRRG